MRFASEGTKSHLLEDWVVRSPSDLAIETTRCITYAKNAPGEKYHPRQRYW